VFSHNPQIQILTIHGNKTKKEEKSSKQLCVQKLLLLHLVLHKTLVLTSIWWLIGFSGQLVCWSLVFHQEFRKLSICIFIFMVTASSQTIIPWWSNKDNVFIYKWNSSERLILRMWKEYIHCEFKDYHSDFSTQVPPSLQYVDKMYLWLYIPHFYVLVHIQFSLIHSFGC